MKRVDRAPVASYLLAVAGMASLLPASKEGAKLIAVAAVAILTWAWVERRTSARIPRNIARAADLLTVTLIVGLAATRFALNEASLTSLGCVLAVAQLARAFRTKRPRDVMIMNGTAVAQVALAAFLTRDVVYLPILFGTVVLGVVASLAVPAAAGGGSDVRIFVGRAAGRAGWMARIGGASQPALLAAAILGLGGVVFVLLPRGAPFRKAKEGRMALAPVDTGGPGRARAPDPGPSPVTGFTEGVALGQIGEVKLVPREAFTVKLTEGGRPLRLPEGQIYFRGAVLDSFDGRNWTRDEAGRPDRWLTTSSGTGVVGIHPELSDRRAGTFRIRQQFRLRASRFRALPALATVIGIELSEDLPRVLDLGGDSFAGERPHGEGFTYRVSSLVSQDAFRPALAEGLDPETAERCLRLYSDSTRLSVVAREIAGAGDSRRKILRLTEWLDDRCEYTLRFKDRPPPRPLEHFLFEARAGHCEYFASALAMMLRAVGVPTRLVTGFRGGQWIESLESYFVRMSDAHAWVEAWVEGRGWVRVDPTPSDASAVQVPESRVPGGQETVEEDWLGERLVFLVREFGPEDREHAIGAAGRVARFVVREGFGIGRPSRPFPPPGIALVVVVLGLALGGRIRRRVGRARASAPSRRSGARRSPRPPPSPFYEAALSLLARAGELRRSSESPREFLVRVRRRWGTSTEAFRTITHAFEGCRYGLEEVSESRRDELSVLVRSLESSLFPAERES